MREDGDLGLLATLNNLDEHMQVVEFELLVYGVRAYMEAMSNQEVIVLEREDAPDYVEL
jgi:hypothetical protein